MYEHKIDDMVRDFEYRLKGQGLDMEMYLSFSGMDMSAFRKTFEEQAKKTVDIRLALEKVAVLEGVEITNEQMMEEINKMAQSYRLSPQQVMSIVSPADLKTDMMVTEAFKIVKDSAVIK